jgi:DUF1680 family protein
MKHNKNREHRLLQDEVEKIATNDRIRVEGEEASLQKIKIKEGFWKRRLKVNAQQAIFHQWEQLEASGCIDNFRIAAGEKDGFRTGWFFADSDAYKWLDAAARIWREDPNPKLASLMEDLIALLARAQAADGYLFTHNQIHFPGTRWVNLQIEHELYCHGHLIEAGVSHYLATGQDNLLHIARLAADRVVEDFLGGGPERTPGHEEIEIALLRLYQISNHLPYFDLAQQFIEQRGRTPGFALSILRQNSSVAKRKQTVELNRKIYRSAHPENVEAKLPEDNFAKKPWNSTLRWRWSALTGKYFQQHAPIRQQTMPVGHAVRFGYLETATAMLCRLQSDQSLLPALQMAWEHMATKRMYLTGGIGSLPGLEGFGNDYELDPETAYAETCAALASIFWSWEMACLTGEAKYSDLIEWQLYNAASVGMGWSGKDYLYNNPLACRGGITRQPWFAIPCCPSNLSRTWADLGKYIYTQDGDEIRIHQYISSRYVGEWSEEVSGRLDGDKETRDEKNRVKNEGMAAEGKCRIEVSSGLPWNGSVLIKIDPPVKVGFTLYLRNPSWSKKTNVKIKGDAIPTIGQEETTDEATASGYDPRQSRWVSIRRIWSPGDVVELDFDTSIQVLKTHPRVKGLRNKAALTRGPLVYCLESVDNPGIDLFAARLDPASLRDVADERLFDGIIKIRGKTRDGQPLTFIPYMLWGNRGESQMSVYVTVGKEANKS